LVVAGLRSGGFRAFELTPGARHRDGRGVRHGEARRVPMRSMGSGLLLILFLATLPATSAHALTVFSTSDEMQVPQNISIAPPEFGELAGSFLVPDFGYGGNSESTGNVYVIPPNGGEAVVLANV